MRAISKLWLAAAFCLGAVAPAAAQDYPARPVQVIVAFPAGGSADIVGRHVMQKLSETTGGSFVVENRTGAGGNIAFAATAAAKPDGYTLLFSTPGIAINPSLYKKANYKLEDFTPIALIGEAPLVLLANPALPIKSVNDLVEAGKRKPDAIRFASSGNGSSSHLAMDVLRSMTGMQYLHVPYRGGGPAMLDVIAGQVDVTMLPISESMPYVRDGRLRALGQTGAKRSPIAPDMPTIEEAGVKGYASTTWYMVLGPAGMPRNVVQTLQAQLDRVLKMPDLQEKLKAAGVSVINGNSEEANAFLQSEYKKWAALIKASGTIIE
ncbi:Bug family tripartite tricarboxylate transporter substrate binding protein [Variovorax sp. RA8]|uniref:Bug family tripartite tricarboxylate transporter substrate binding protein n=1 Tax=Variovorax sp. (strain JCM 16519 / RA8) TaxID=662548 RepID=UPI001316A212|nr:tripartite tricarboxylate transporter substrate binding protein [Variovorax sp. RA8]VTU22180.1 Argininosuccinate lyase [Variovorax sp. RA8]